MSEVSVRIQGDRARVQQGRGALSEVRLPDLLREIARSQDATPSCGILPEGVRFWRERDDAVALAVEIPPQVRTVRWLKDDSPVPFGPSARYESYRLAFPFIVMLIVLREGEVTGLQQLFYKTTPLRVNEELLLPNLYNVVPLRDQRCWLCLQHLRPLRALDWCSKIDVLVDHVFGTGFNRSAEIYEGDSYWQVMRELDPRVRSVAAWQEATRQDPLFPLSVPWKPAQTSLRAELSAMLDRVVPPRNLDHARGWAGLVLRASGRGAAP